MSCTRCCGATQMPLSPSLQTSSPLSPGLQYRLVVTCTVVTCTVVTCTLVTGMVGSDKVTGCNAVWCVHITGGASYICRHWQNVYMAHMQSNSNSDHGWMHNLEAVLLWQCCFITQHAQLNKRNHQTFMLMTKQYLPNKHADACMYVCMHMCLTHAQAIRWPAAVLDKVLTVLTH